MYTAHDLISDHPYGAHMLVSQKFILPQKKKRYESIKRIDSKFSDGRAAVCLKHRHYSSRNFSTSVGTNFPNNDSFPL